MSKPNEKFTILASDFAWGGSLASGYTGLSVVSHPAPNGAVAEHFATINDVGGYVVDETQDAPINYADADGSVLTFNVSANSVNQPDDWVVNTPHQSSQKFLLPRDMAR